MRSGYAVVFDLQILFGFSIPRGAQALPSASRPPAAARPCHVRPTQQPTVSVATERGPPPNSASGGGVERCLPGAGLLDLRHEVGSPRREGYSSREGFPSFWEAFPSRGIIFVSLVLRFRLYVFFFLGMEQCYHPPPGILAQR